MRFVVRYSLLVVCLLLAGKVLAAGLAVSPDQLSLQGLVGQEITGQFEVVNISEVTTNYQVKSDLENSRLKIEPAVFSLLSGDSRRVQVTANWPKPAQVAATINILAQAASTSTFAALTGVKLPLNIKIAAGTGNAASWSYWLFSVSLLILLGSGLWWWQEERRHKKWWHKAWGKADLFHHKRFF